MKNKYRIMALFAAALGLSGWYLYPSPAQQPSIAAPLFSAVALGRVDVEGGLIEISARQNGIYENVLVGEGDHVQRGQILAVQEDQQERIELKLQRAKLQQMAAQLASMTKELNVSRRELNRLLAIEPRSVIAEQAIDRAQDEVEQNQLREQQQQAALSQQRAQVEAAQFLLDQRTIRAPEAGQIVQVLARPGMGASTVNVTTAFTLLPQRQKIITAQLDQRYVGAVAVGDRATISSDIATDDRFDGKVVRLGSIVSAPPTGDKNDDGFVEVVVTSNPLPLLMGQRVMVRFER